MTPKLGLSNFTDERQARCPIRYNRSMVIINDNRQIHTGARYQNAVTGIVLWLIK